MVQHKTMTIMEYLSTQIYNMMIRMNHKRRVKSQQIQSTYKYRPPLLRGGVTGVRDVLTRLGVLESHLVLLVLGFGGGPDGLQTARCPVFTVCRGCDLGLRGAST